MTPTTAPIDILHYLDVGPTAVFKAGQPIYNDAPSGLYCVVDGLVRVFRGAEGFEYINVGLYAPEDIFGLGLLIPRLQGERAVALKKSTVMAWTRGRLDEMLEKRPGLGLALAVLAARESQRQVTRIKDLTLQTGQRLALALIRLSEQFRSATLPGFTQDYLAAEIVTGREVIAQYMNKFRRAGAVTYDRKGITVFVEELRKIAGGGH